MEDAVLALRARHPAWGARKLRHRLLRLGHTGVPSASTVHAILVRHGCISQEVSAVSRPFQRFEHPEPNDLWQMDFKGHVPLLKGRCHPLPVLDDHSRFNLCLQACADEAKTTVQERLVVVFERYGLPRRMSMDNGAPWGDTQYHFTALDLWLMKQGIVVTHSRPYHPQTQGKDERFHKTLLAEVLQGPPMADLIASQRAFDRWRPIYNQERPHDALGGAVPQDRYQPSSRDYRPHPLEPEYAQSRQVRRVQENGRVRWQGHDYRVGKAFVGEPVALRPTTQEHLLEVYWSTIRIALIDLASHTSVHGKRLP